MNKFCIIDAHCDTIAKLSDQNVSINKYGDTHVSIEGLKEGCVDIQFFAACICARDINDSPLQTALNLIEAFENMVKKYGDCFYPITKASDIHASKRAGKIGALLAIEGGDALEGKISNLHLVYNMGVRLITLTWNYNNEIGSAAMDTATEWGLTAFGAEVIKEMNRLGMIIDVSHLSEKAFWDVVEVSSPPIIASHSNAKALCNHPRNLDDSQIKAIVEKGGVIGINFYPPFLSWHKADIHSIVNHIEYIAGLAGVDGVGFGSDFDGVDRLPEGVNGPQNFPDIIDELLRLNYTEESVYKICYGNFFRLMERILKGIGEEAWQDRSIRCIGSVL